MGCGVWKAAHLPCTEKEGSVTHVVHQFFNGAVDELVESPPFQGGNCGFKSHQSYHFKQGLLHTLNHKQLASAASSHKSIVCFIIFRLNMKIVSNYGENNRGRLINPLSIT